MMMSQYFEPSFTFNEFRLSKLFVYTSSSISFCCRIPKTASPGSYLLGTITFAKDEFGKKANTYSFKYIVADSPKKTNKSSSEKEKNKEKNKEEDFQEALRDLKISWLSKYG